MYSTTFELVDSAGQPASGGSSCRWSRQDWRLLALVLILGAVVFFPGLGTFSIIDSSEGYYAEASREMFESGDYITPHLNYRPWFEKPILTYWLMAASYHVFGVNEFAARFPAAASGILAAALLFVIARQFLTSRAAFLSSLVLLSTPFFLVVGRICLTDMPFTLYVTAALGGLFLAAEGASIGFLLLGYVAVALALMAKGPLAIVLTGVVLLPYLLWTCRNKQDWQMRLARLRPVLGAAILLFIAVPWYLAVSIVTKGAFAQDFFIDQNLGRAAGTTVHRNLKVWYYLPFFWGGGAPWSIVLLPAAALSRCLRHREVASRRSRILQFCTIWLVVMFLFFSIVPTKLSTYILPIFPALAILVGASLDTLMRLKNVRRFAIVGCLGCVATATVLALLPVLSKYLAGVVVSAVVMLVALLFALGLCTVALWRNQSKRAFSYLTAIMLAACSVSVPAGLAIFHREHQEGFYHLVMYHMGTVADKNDASLATMGRSAFSAAFYLRRRVPVLDKEQDFQEFLNDGKDEHWVLVHKHRLDDLARARRPARLIEQQGKWYLFAIADNSGNAR